MSTYGIEVKELLIRLDKQRTLGPLTFHLSQGQKAVIQGQSGCGKSTLLKSLLGFIPYQQGTIVIDGTPLTPVSVWDLRRRVAYVAQEPELGRGTVRSLLERPFHYHCNISLYDNLRHIPTWLERFYLSQDILDKDISTLSGGEKQRIALISVILLNRTVYLLDEVTSALDYVSREAVLEFFAQQHEVAAIFVSHDSDSFAFIDHIITIPSQWEVT